MPDEARLREQARAAIENGKLPSHAPDRTWGGPGVGATCSVCEKPVTKDQLEFEVQFARDGDNPGLAAPGQPVLLSTRLPPGFRLTHRASCPLASGSIPRFECVPCALAGRVCRGSDARPDHSSRD